MEIRRNKRLKFYLFNIFSLFYFLCLTSTFAFADTGAYKVKELCVSKGLDCLLISEKQGQGTLDVFSSFFSITNIPLNKTNFNDNCETKLQIAKHLTPKNAFVGAQKLHLSNLDGDSELNLVRAESPPILNCKVTGSSMSATFGILICALIGFVIFSNRRRV